MKAECKDCYMSEPNEEVYYKDTFRFPDEYECCLGEDSFPDCAHMCIEFMAREDGYRAAGE